MKKIFLIFGVALLLLACGAGNNITFTTVNGSCANGESYAPYCMAVTIQNNVGGQNYISSTNFPISGLTMAISGANNILSPATNKNSMDPNNCTGNNLNPGSTCTFYLQINSESYPALSSETVNLNVNYNVQDSFLQSTFGLGGNTPTGSSNLTIYENTNLYAMQNNGSLWTINAAGSGVSYIESNDTVNSFTVDNTSYGYMYLGGTNGIYSFGPLESYASTSLSIAPLSGANNLFTVSGTLYASGSTSGGVGIWTFSLANESWTNSNSPTYPFGTIFATNVNTVSPSATLYLANSNVVYACINSTANKTCISEGNPITVSGQPALVTALSFASGVSSPYTGLFAGTTIGVFAESATSTPSTTATWAQVTANGQPMSNNILSMAVSGGNLYAGDSSGYIWLINSSTPTVESEFMSQGGNVSITNMQIDNFSNMLYYVSLSSGIYSLYACSLATSPCVPVLVQTFTSSSIAGLGLGSQLSN